MILLDTNVISEPLKATGNPKIADWINAQNIETLYLSTIGLAELRFGIAALPSGKRKEVLHASL
jgi:toxin FitB